MSQHDLTDALLVLPRLRIQNANAISSPLTHGFPAITAFLGLATALERRFFDDYKLHFDSVGVVCHWHQEQTSGNRYQHAFNLTRNPVTKSGATAAIVEEGRIHLDISLLFGLRIDDDSPLLRYDDREEQFVRAAGDAIQCMRVAGGSVLPPVADTWQKPSFEWISSLDDEGGSTFRRLRRRLLPGFALVSGADILNRQLKDMQRLDSQATALDALLHLSRFNWSAQVEADADADANTGANAKAKVKWDHDRRDGWIVPIPVGYGALSELHPPGAVANVRDPDIPFRFVESLYSIGRWLGPHRLAAWRELMWYRDTDPTLGTYRALNDFRNPEPEPEAVGEKHEH